MHNDDNSASNMYMDCQEENSYTINKMDKIHIINSENIPIT